jgi:ABC-type lipoprotein release transport system permease subunit
MALALSGVLVGFIAALVLTRFMSKLLFGVSAYDPISIMSITVLLAAVALLANLLPGRRASMVDPMVALRYE